ncbi:MAG: sigma-70 family RNA polymerase sigma factor [Acidobacteriota bacterium]|jgi:RNA polymerase sigma-70 factor (ECF subfamily)
MVEKFERIVREYQDKIFRLSYSMLRDRAAAEETAQDVLVRVWKGLPGFRSKSSLSTWIYAITRNACLTAQGRRELRSVSLDEPAPRREAERRAVAEWAIPESLEAAELLNRLPARYRQVVALFYMQEKSYDEVARMLDLPVGTVKTYLFRARKSLAEELARERVVKGGT